MFWNRKLVKSENPKTYVTVNQPSLFKSEKCGKLNLETITFFSPLIQIQENVNRNQNRRKKNDYFGSLVVVVVVGPSSVGRMMEYDCVVNRYDGSVIQVKNH